MYTKKSLHGIISVHFHQRRSEFGQKLTKFDSKSWNQKKSVQESIQESKRIGFSSQHQPPEPKNPSLKGIRIRMERSGWRVVALLVGYILPD